MAWGRGGAGNIQQAEDAGKRAAEDIEASSTPLDPSTEPSKISQQEYAHSGRGGAGNWYSPAELNSTGIFTSNAKPQPQSSSTSNSQTAASSLFGDPTLAPAAQQGLNEQEIAAGHRGRGGAGNFIWSSGSEQEARAKAEEERLRKAGKIEENVIRDVESGLAMPGRAKVAGSGDRWEGWEGLERV